MRANREIWKFFWISIASLLCATSAWADSWVMPTTETTSSDNGQYRVTIIPRDLESQLAYFEDKVDEKEAAGQQPGSANTSAVAFVERKAGGGNWVELWRKPLVNDVAPVSALISSDGKYVVTFDNWHSAGYGDNVIVVYGADGTLIRKLGLEQILPPYYVYALPKSISSRWWSGERKLLDDQVTLELSIADTSTERHSGQQAFVKLRYNVETGATEFLNEAAWERARIAAVEKTKIEVSGGREYIATQRAPLTPPTSMDEREWGQYVYLAMKRLGQESSAIEQREIVFLPNDSSKPSGSHNQIIYELENGSTDKGSKVIILATPDQPALIQFLERHRKLLSKKQSEGITFKVFASDTYWPRIRDLLALSGADVVQLPMTPIEQSEKGLANLKQFELELDKVEQSYPEAHIAG